MEKFEVLLEEALVSATRHSPKKLRDACFYAVFPSGGRIRPRLGLAISEAVGQAPDRALLGGVVAVELIHCASLVHDDLPCFDDAAARRGKPSVHRKYGEDVAVLVGDALIVAAFGVAVEYSSHRPELILKLVKILSESVGASTGIIAGQAAETEPGVSVRRVHLMKTGALFEGVAAMAAAVTGSDPAPWRAIGQKLGIAYQVADDLLDAAGSVRLAGKPILQDARHERPSAVLEESLATAVESLDGLIASAIGDIPPCPGEAALADMLRGVATRLCPPSLILWVANRNEDRAVLSESDAAYA